MEELYVEGLASHGGPLSRASTFREGVAKRWIGVRVRRAIEREIRIRAAHAVKRAEGNTAIRVIAGCWLTLRGLRTMTCTEPSCARTGGISRARPSGLIAGRDAQGTPRR